MAVALCRVVAPLVVVLFAAVVLQKACKLVRQLGPFAAQHFAVVAMRQVEKLRTYLLQLPFLQPLVVVACPPQAVNYLVKKVSARQRVNVALYLQYLERAKAQELVDNVQWAGQQSLRRAKAQHHLRVVKFGIGADQCLREVVVNGPPI